MSSSSAASGTVFWIGVPDRADRGGLGGFRRFFYGVVRNVARRIERKKAGKRESQAPATFDFEAVEMREETLSNVFDRAWARSVLDEAVALMLHRAARDRDEARRRVEIRHLRFHEDLPVRAIAERWNVDAESIHVDYARARRAFRAALLKITTFHHLPPLGCRPEPRETPPAAARGEEGAEREPEVRAPGPDVRQGARPGGSGGCRGARDVR